MVQQPQFFRPLWTCGRYNAKADTAIMYNLIEGQSYFFESHSARVINEILSVARYDELHVETISAHTGIAVESILDFMQTLVGAGLVCTKRMTAEERRDFQRKQGKIAIEQVAQRKFTSTGQVDFSTAEEAYANSLDVNTCSN